MPGRLDLEGLRALRREFAELPLVSISNAQRAPLPWASWAGTVHHGLPLELHRPHYDAGRYLVFLGRISPEKRVDRAIALRAGLPLKVAAKVDPADREYFGITGFIVASVDEAVAHVLGQENFFSGWECRRPDVVSVFRRGRTQRRAAHRQARCGDVDPSSAGREIKK